MGTEHCPRCGRPYTAGEVTGLSVLKTRPAALGGPWLEFACPGCRFLLRLLPHGNGRYAIPGEPPPPIPSDSDRTVPWRREGASSPAGNPSPVGRIGAEHGTAAREEGTADGTPSAGRRTGRAPPPTPASPKAAEPPAPSTAREAEAPLSREAAREELGMGPTDGPEAVEEAFRRRALLCHPDKFAHLDADFQTLAATKFRRLQAARNLLLS